MAWNYARFVNKVVEEGKAGYNIPMYVNAWLQQPNHAWPGTYPSGGPVPQVIAALMAVIGHSRSPYIGFHGGRGVAPAAGGALVLAPGILLAIFPVFALTILATRISSIGSLSGSLAGLQINLPCCRRRRGA